MTFQEFFARVSEMLVGRTDGPLSIRFVFQPAVAAIFAIRAGLNDASDRRTPFLRSLFKNPAQRRDLLREGWKDIGKVFIIAVVLDVVYAVVVHRWIFPGQALLIGTVLAIVPYVMVRGPVTRIASAHMTQPSHRIASLAASAQSSGAPGQFAILFGVQTVGAVILFWNGVPLYQQILADPAAHEAGTEHLSWALSSIAFMQLGYWFSYRTRPPLPRFTNALLGHVALFLTRMGFVFATSVFGFLFITQKPGFHIPSSRYAITLLGLFALYCYVRELERLGRAFLEREKEPIASVR